MFTDGFGGFDRGGDVEIIDGPIFGGFGGFGGGKGKGYKGGKGKGKGGKKGGGGGCGSVQDPNDAGNLPQNLLEMSRRLAKVLRHESLELGLEPDPDGFVEVDKIMNLPEFMSYSDRDLEVVVQESFSKHKPRFLLQNREDNSVWIRATHRHTGGGIGAPPPPFLSGEGPMAISNGAPAALPALSAPSGSPPPLLPALEELPPVIPALEVPRSEEAPVPAVATGSTATPAKDVVVDDDPWARGIGPVTTFARATGSGNSGLGIAAAPAPAKPAAAVSAAGWINGHTPDHASPQVTNGVASNGVVSEAAAATAAADPPRGHDLVEAVSLPFGRHWTRHLVPRTTDQCWWSCTEEFNRSFKEATAEKAGWATYWDDTTNRQYWFHEESQEFFYSTSEVPSRR
eukprot:TRINITY_DN6655_c0_g1_i1.p1 TRINITY_DN6655_c0_g1~~TRINITY_DN6655_c0_g1_i1.p1  ORF type:complete len:400 (-),score=72.62 TRINITY_DN6655_c0_g1_i1:278-1477(-)